MKTWTKVALGAITLPILACTGIWGIGSTFPESHEATVTVHVPAPPAEVEARVRDWAHATTWKSDVTEVEDLGLVDGHQRFRECTSECLVLEILPGPDYTTRIVDHPDFGGTWTWSFAPAEGGTRVTLTERGTVPSPIFRFFMHLAFGPDANIRHTAEALSASFQKHG